MFPRRHLRLQRSPLLAAGVLSAALAAGACKSKKEAPTPVASAQTNAERPCPAGQSKDPTQAELRPAVDAFRDKDYATAARLFDALVAKYPSSATVLVWRGDVALFDKQSEYKAAAKNARAYYERAQALHDKGCRLPEAEHYYLRFD